MYNEINKDNLKLLCTGCSFLGSGGGGDTNVLYDIVSNALTKHGPVSIISPHDLKDEDIVIAIEFVGAPLPAEARQCNAKILIKPVLDLVVQDQGIKIDALMPVEIGGSNALVPLCIAGEVGLPLVDCDLLGRALPEITMISTNIFDRMPNKAYICDPSTGQSQIIACASYSELETKARAIASSHNNCTAVLVPIVMTGAEINKMSVHKTVSQAIHIGAQDSLDNLLRVTQGVVQCAGKITEWKYDLEAGFLVGNITIRTKEGRYFYIKVKNEFLTLLNEAGVPIAHAPDIITLLRQNTLSPILSDQLKIEDDIVCFTCKGPDIWYTKKGLSLLPQ